MLKTPSYYIKGKYAYLTEDYVFRINNKRFKIPKGFKWNGCSIPKYLRFILDNPLSYKYIIASLIHDWFYYTHSFNKNKVDNLFYYHLIKTGNCKYKSYIMEKSVNLFGLNYWNNKEEDIKYMIELMQSINYEDRRFYDCGIFNEIKYLYFQEDVELKFIINEYKEK